jgi:NADPH-dependent FMN reductase
VLFCTPEYAGSLPGSLKNLLDWTVRGGELYEKPVAYVGVAADGRGAGAEATLRAVLGYVGAAMLEEACVRVYVAHDAVGPDGRISDESTVELLLARCVASPSWLLRVVDCRLANGTSPEQDEWMDSIVDALLTSEEPSIRWKVRTRVLDDDPESRAIVRLRDEIRRSPRVRTLLEHVAGASYRKWSGGHWVLITLADIGYPPGDPNIDALAERVMQTWLAPRYYAEFDTRTAPYKEEAVPLMNGRYRRCGSQHGGALLAAITLDVQAAATDRLVERLLHWQWPDGGWNCSRNLSAASSSVYETLLPMRGLAAYATAHGDPTAGRRATGPPKCCSRDGCSTGGPPVP